MGASRKLQATPDPGPWAQEVDRARALVHDLRNPIGAIALATELLQGPLAKVQVHLDPKTAKSLQTTLEALSCAVEQAVYLVKSEHHAPRPDLRVVSAVEDPAPEPESTVAPKAAPSSAAPKKAKLKRAPRQSSSTVDVVALLRKLEILVVTRSELPVLLAVQCSNAMRLRANGAELMRALSNLVENAIEASAKGAPNRQPWTVNVRCEVQDDGGCVFIVSNHGDAPSSEVMRWLQDESATPLSGPASSKSDAALHGVGLSSVRRVMEELGGGLTATHREGETEFRAWMPAQRVLDHAA